MIQTNNIKPKQKRMMVTIDINAVIYGNKEKSDRIYTDYLKKLGIKTEYNNLPLDSNLKLPDQAPDAAVFIITKYNVLLGILCYIVLHASHGAAP